MSATIDILDPSHPKQILVVAANPSISAQTGWPIGFWWAELTHPYWEFVEHGYQVTFASPDGGPLEADGFSDPEHESGYSADDLISLGFKSSRTHAALLTNTRRLADVDPDEFDAVLFVGGQAPMYQFDDNAEVNRAIAEFHDRGKPTAVVCHATVALLTARAADGSLIVDGRTWTGFANSEEVIADAMAGQQIQPFRIEDRAHRLTGTNFIVRSAFTPHAVRDGNLITGQQQYSGAAAAALIIEALGV